MSDIQTRLAEMFHQLAPEPPHELSPSRIVERGREIRRAQRLMALTATAAVILVVVFALTTSSIGRDTGPSAGNSASPSGSSSLPSPSKSGVDELYAHDWKLVELVPAIGPEQQPTGPMSFHFIHGEKPSDPSIISRGKCSAAQATIRETTMTFVQEFVTEATTACGSELGVQQTRFVDQVCSGTVAWSIHAGRLSILNDGNKLVFESVP